MSLQACAEALKSGGHKFASDGVDNHLVLQDVGFHCLSAGKVETVCGVAWISLGNAVHGDASDLSTGGIRIRSPEFINEFLD